MQRECVASAVIRNPGKTALLVVVVADVLGLLDLLVLVDVFADVAEVADLLAHGRNLDVRGPASRQCEGEREGHENRNQATSHAFTERSGQGVIRASRTHRAKLTSEPSSCRAPRGRTGSRSAEGGVRD